MKNKIILLILLVLMISNITSKLRIKRNIGEAEIISPHYSSYSYTVENLEENTKGINLPMLPQFKLNLKFDDKELKGK